MAKILKIQYPNKCNGCELCVLETQRQLKKVGLEGALIRIFRKKETDKEYIEHSLEMDPRVNSLDIEKITEICPQKVFEMGEEDNG